MIVYCIICICSVVKEEIIDDEAHLPCFNGRVVSWVSVIKTRWERVLGSVAFSVVICELIGNI
jgi:hypothetical protein